MQSQFNTDALVNMSDFSSSLLRADSERATMNTASQQSQAIEAHRNLSAALAGIRDEGSAIPARPAASSRQTTRNNEVKNGNHGKLTQKSRRLSTPSSVTEFSRRARQKASEQERMQAMTNSESTVGSSVYEAVNTQRAKLSSATAGEKPFNETVQASQGNSRQQLLLLIAISFFVSMAFVIFELHSQTDEMRDSINQYEDDIKEIKQSDQQSSEMSMQLASLTEKLTELKQELLTVKAEYTTFNNIHAQEKQIETSKEKPVVESVNQDNVKQEVSVIQDSNTQIVRETKLPMLTVGKVTADTSNKVKVNINVDKKPDAVVIKDTVDTITSDGWIVNLASLSSQSRAKKASEALRQSGLLPRIEEAVVDGNKVYRLSVSGFATRKDAMAFVVEAGEKYGWHGGWVRHS